MNRNEWEEISEELIGLGYSIYYNHKKRRYKVYLPAGMDENTKDIELGYFSERNGFFRETNFSKLSEDYSEHFNKIRDVCSTKCRLGVAAIPQYKKIKEIMV
jgi:hypothetical protein